MELNEEELLRDSLEISIECDDGEDGGIISTGGSNNKKPQKNTDRQSCLSLLPSGVEVSNIAEKEEKPKAHTSRPVVKRKAKNMIEMNKMNITKGPARGSYSKIHQKNLGKAPSTEKKGENEAGQEMGGPSTTAIEMCKQVLWDDFLNEKDEFNNLGLDENINLQDYGVETNHYSGLHSFENNEIKDGYGLKSTQFNDRNISQLHKGYHMDWSSMPNNNVYPKEMQRYTNGAVSSHVLGGVTGQPRLPQVRPFPSSVQSAPADMQEYQDPSYEKSCRSYSLNALRPARPMHVDLNNSISSLTSSKSGSEQGAYMTYSGLYANTKENARASYKPYTLSDYKSLKKQSIQPGGLGPDTKSEEHQQKAKKAIRQKEYSVAVKQRNASENCHTKKKPLPTSKEISVKQQEANSRRMKALQYAKAIPKPVTLKNENVWRSSSQAAEKPRTLLDILQQRHEDEKKMIDAMRRDLQTKLKTK